MPHGCSGEELRRAIARTRSIIRTEPFLLVRGRLQKREGTLNVVAERFSPLRIDASLVAPPAHNFR
jgi:hypothetical protein